MFTNNEIRKNREDICNSCSSKNGTRCGECNCFLILLRKINSANCPLNKW